MERVPCPNIEAPLLSGQESRAIQSVIYPYQGSRLQRRYSIYFWNELLTVVAVAHAGAVTVRV